MARVVVVGGGVIGTMHAVQAVEGGHDVVHLERDAEPRSASVRNFGLCWVSGRRVGAELALALRARELWEAIGRRAPGVGFRPDGSITVAQHPAEVTVLEQVVERDDAGSRGLRLLEPADVRAVNPALRGSYLAGLHCALDGVCEPRQALPAIRDAILEPSGHYQWHPGRTITEVDAGVVVDHTGERHRADRTIICTGAETQGPLAELMADAPLRRVRLQMMQTEPWQQRLTTSLADGDSLRYYPAFDVPALAALPPQAAVPARYAMQLLVSQRADGALTIGDTHEYDEPFAFDVDEAPYTHLIERLGSILGQAVPRITRRWAGVYSQCLDSAICHRAEVIPGTVVVTGPGGRGMTLSPAIAEETLQLFPPGG